MAARFEAYVTVTGEGYAFAVTRETDEGIFLHPGSIKDLGDLHVGDHLEVVVTPNLRKPKPGQRTAKWFALAATNLDPEDEEEDA